MRCVVLFCSRSDVNFVGFFVLLLGVIVCIVVVATSLYIAIVAAAAFVCNGVALGLFYWRVPSPQGDSDATDEAFEEEEALAQHAARQHSLEAARAEIAAEDAMDRDDD